MDKEKNIALRRKICGAVKKVNKNLEELIAVNKKNLDVYPDNAGYRDNHARNRRSQKVIQAMLKPKYNVVIENPGTFEVSYVNKPEDKLEDNRRIKTTLRRFLTRQIDDTLTEQEAANVENLFFQAIGFDEVCFEELTGDDFMKAYETSLGGASCMSGSYFNGVKDRLTIWAQNPNAVKLLVGRMQPGDNTNAFRTLLWFGKECYMTDYLYLSGRFGNYQRQIVLDLIHDYLSKKYKKPITMRDCAKRNQYGNASPPCLVKLTKPEGWTTWPSRDTMGYDKNLKSGKIYLSNKPIPTLKKKVKPAKLAVAQA